MLPNPVAMTRNVTSWSGKVPIRSFAEIICVNGDSPDTEIRVEAELFVDRTWKGQDKGARRKSTLRGPVEIPETSEPGFRPNINVAPVPEPYSRVDQKLDGQEGS